MTTPTKYRIRYFDHAQRDTIEEDIIDYAKAVNRANELASDPDVSMVSLGKMSETFELIPTTVWFVDTKVDSKPKPDWKNYFTAPFVFDKMEYVFDKGMNMVLQYAGLNNQTAQFENLDSITTQLESLVSEMNGTPSLLSAAFYNPKLVGTSSEAYIEFSLDKDGTHVARLEIRGWGYLTGHKGLPPQTAAAVQDALGQYVVKCMTDINSRSGI